MPSYNPNQFKVDLGKAVHGWDVVISVPSAPTLGTATSGGTITAATYYIVVTYVNANGETIKSAQSSQVTTGSTSTLTVNSPAASTGATQYRIYVGSVNGGPYYLQGSAVNLGTNTTFTAPFTFSGTVVPVVNTCFLGTYKIALVRSGFTWTQTSGLLSAITGGSNFELNNGNTYAGANNYQSGFSGTGRQRLVSRSITQDNTNNKAIWFCSDTTWLTLNAGNGTAVAAVIFYQPLTAAADSDCPIVGYYDFGTSYLMNGSDFVVKCDSVNGVMQIT